MKPSIISHQPAEMYHAIKALSASGAWALTYKCPALFWHDSPWNDDRPPEKNPVFDIGTAAHLAILEPSLLADRVAIVDAADWRTNAAKDARDLAYRSGLVPLLLADWRLVETMATVLRSDRRAAELLEGADTEVSFYWEDGPVDCKARADVVTAGRRIIADIKTATTASPAFFQRQAGNLGYDMRADWYRAGWRLASQLGEYPAYKFIVIAKDPPHLVEVYELSEEDIETAHAINRRAVALFAECQESGEWPSYGRGREIKVPLANWTKYQRRLAADPEALDVPAGAEGWAEVL